MFDPVKLFEDIADDNSMEFIYGAKPFLNWEVTQKDLTAGNLFLAMFPFTEQGALDNGKVGEWAVSTILWVGCKFDASATTYVSLDETERQKYDRRLKTLSTMVQTVLDDLCASGYVQVMTARRFRELNKFDENTDVVGCELTFKYDILADNVTISFPVAQSGSSITSSSFSANWLAPAGATAYYLDVATDELFTHKLTGYNNKSIGNVLTAPVTGLASLTDYYYRLRATNGDTTSIDSAVIHVKTL